MLTKLSELLFVETVRRYVEALPATTRIMISGRIRKELLLFDELFGSLDRQIVRNDAEDSTCEVTERRGEVDDDRRNFSGAIRSNASSTSFTSSGATTWLICDRATRAMPLTRTPTTRVLER